MKVKKMKLFGRCLDSIAKRKVGEIQGVQLTKIELAPGIPLLLLPTKGKYCLSEVQVINKIITSIDVSELESESQKMNAYLKRLAMSVFTYPNDKHRKLILVHTAYGCCAYDAIEDIETQLTTVQNDVPVEVVENIRDKFEIL
jgi:hypothetical protein